MKKLYYLILTLFTVTCCNAADSPPPGTPTEDDCRSTAMFSDAGSAGSIDCSRPLLRPATYVLPEGVDQFDRDKLVGVLADTAEAYSVLFQYTDGIDTRVQDLSNHVGRMLNLPKDEVQASNLVANSLSKLRDNIAEAFKRLKDAKKSKKLTVEQNKALEARISSLNASIGELTERNNELEQECATYQPLIAAKLNESTANEATIADLTGKVELAHSRTKDLFEQISTLEEELVSARAASERAKNGDTERDLAAAKTNLATVTAERDAANARADTEKARADTEKARADNATAEKNRLQAALNSAQSRQSDAAPGGDESTPLVVRRLNTGDTPAGPVRGGAQPKKDEGCPCLVM